MLNMKDELVEIITKFALSGWDIIALPSKTWLNANAEDKISDLIRDNLICAIKEADKQCGSCGCDFDPLYKKALSILEVA